MASGHANRANRPNTWLHRPAMRREVLTCQPGAVHTWHIADIDADDEHVRFTPNNGRLAAHASQHLAVSVKSTRPSKADVRRWM